jgi:hypothetical protein
MERLVRLCASVNYFCWSRCLSSACYLIDSIRSDQERAVQQGEACDYRANGFVGASREGAKRPLGGVAKLFARQRPKMSARRASAQAHRTFASASTNDKA